MFSIETLPCPCKDSSVLRADERAADKLALEVGDPVGLTETQPSIFSIRDYVSTSRCKGIEASWPFSQQFLQLCSKHGVRDVLPPFEPPDSVRARCCRKSLDPDQLIACSVDEKASSQIDSVEIDDAGLVDTVPHNTEPELCSDKDQYPLSEKAKRAVDGHEILDDESTECNGEIVSAVTSQDQIERTSDKASELHCSVQITRSISEASSEVEVVERHRSKFRVLRGPSEKKCRLILKSGSPIETIRTEETVSTCSTVSDPMASKVCPVCKVFTSSSNTTLNAHIDQCLSGESNTKWLTSEPPKLKVKPKKKRLMVDIYATAAHSTLEDLDRRNGTNWAVEMAFIAPINEAHTEIKRPKLSPIVARDDESEGAVYVDSNGIKLRILSKFNDAPPSITRENFQLKKHGKDIKEGDSLLESKKKCSASNYLKFIKVKPQTKKLSSFNAEIQAASGGNHHANVHKEKEESPTEMENAHEESIIKNSVTLSHWVCSKRSQLHKKSNHKDIHNFGNSALPTTRNVSSENNQPEVSNPSAVKSHILKLPKPSKDLPLFSNGKGVDFQSNTVQITAGEKRKSPNPPLVSSKMSSESAARSDLMPKTSRSLETSISSPKIRGDENHKSTVRRSDKFSNTTTRPSNNCHPQLKAKKTSIMKKSALVERPSLLEGSKGDTSGKRWPSKKFRKHRSIPSGVDGEPHRSMKHLGITTARTSKTIRPHRSDCSEIFTRPRAEEIMDQESPSSSIPQSEEEDVSPIEMVKYNSLKRRPPHNECNEPELTSSMQVKTLACVGIGARNSMRNCVVDPVNTDTVIMASSSRAKLVPRSSGEENVHSICDSEAHIEPITEKSCGEQEIQCCNASHDEVIGQKIQVGHGLDFRGEAEICVAQYPKRQAETTSIQESSACLTSHGDAVPEITRENSSVTSIRMASVPSQKLGHDHSRSGSPVSTASTISPPSPKYSESEPLMRPIAVPCELSIGGTEERNKERRNKEVEAFPMAKEPEAFSDDQPCCCSRRESLNRESQFLRPNVTVLPYKGKQISNLNVVPSAPSSFSRYSSSRTDAMATTILESPTESLATKASVDFSSPSPSPRTPPASSILRLMGKNLMVANNEEFQLQTVHHSAENPSNAQWESLPYQYHELPDGTVFFGQAPLMVNQHFCQHPSMTRLNMIPDQQVHREFNKISTSSSASNLQRTSASHLHHQMMREVITIDDSPELGRKYTTNTLPAAHVLNPNHMQQRQIACLPLQSQFSSRGYSIPMNRENVSEGFDPLQRPFTFQPRLTTHLTPSLYYSQTLL